jgi:hypothetical protein
MTISLAGDDAARAARWLRQRHASVPPLPLTLDAEGADQPFLLEEIERQSSSGRRQIRVVIVGAGYT